MHATLPLLEVTDFPALRRGQLETLQVNLGYKCNQQCLHCHVNAGPKRKEMMSYDTIETILNVLSETGTKILDLTGGAPEMNDHFKYLVASATGMGVKVMDRCNLTILTEPGYEDMASFLAEYKVEVVASLPCYLEENVDAQRGKGVFEKSLAGMRSLNHLGYGKPGSELVLNLVYNPVGPSLPPSQSELQAAYKLELAKRFDLYFNQLFTLSNMPIKRFGSMLISKGQFKEYMTLLKDNFSAENLSSVMCRSLVSVDWQGYIYDCDFNQQLALSVKQENGQKRHVRDLLSVNLEGAAIVVADHCYGCTAGQGSSCGGALD